VAGVLALGAGEQVGEQDPVDFPSYDSAELLDIQYV
jgi:hypothetical protein